MANQRWNDWKEKNIYTKVNGAPGNYYARGFRRLTKKTNLVIHGARVSGTRHDRVTVGTQKKERKTKTRRRR